MEEKLKQADAEKKKLALSVKRALLKEISSVDVEHINDNDDGIKAEEPVQIVINSPVSKASEASPAKTLRVVKKPLEVGPQGERKVTAETSSVPREIISWVTIKNNNTKTTPRKAVK
jgi:hypothetical protein